jgi:hypothetical protein
MRFTPRTRQGFVVAVLAFVVTLATATFVFADTISTFSACLTPGVSSPE